MPVQAIHGEAVLGRIAARLAKHVEVVLSELDLSPSQYRVLSVLSLGPEGASRLAGSLSISRPSLTGVVDGLVAHGFIARKDDLSDRRRVALALTPAGSRALRKADHMLEQRLVEILSHASDAEAELARRGLEAWHGPLEADRATRRLKR